MDDLVGKVQVAFTRVSVCLMLPPVEFNFLHFNSNMGTPLQTILEEFPVASIMLISLRSVLFYRSATGLLESKVFWMFTTNTICPMIDLRWILGHPLRTQREQLYDIKFSQAKTVFFQLDSYGR